MRSLASFIAAAVLFSSPFKETDSRPKDYVAQIDHCPADLDGNGEVRVPDLIMLLAAWGPCPLCGNGVVDSGEECDPPDGETCDDDCQIIPQDCCLPHFAPGCDDPICESTVCEVDPDCCDTVWDESCAILAAELCPECHGLDCCGFAHSEPGCTDFECAGIVCGARPSCCDSAWDQFCVALADLFCEQCMP